MAPLRFIAAVIALAVLGVAGCSGDTGEADPTGGATTGAAAPSTSPAPTKPTGIEPPEKPAAMANADEEGAIAAAEYFLRMTTYAAATGDTAQLEAMSGPDCEFCGSYLESMDNLYGEGKGETWATVPDLDISFAHAKPTQEANQYQVNMRTHKGTFDYFDEEDGLQQGPEEALVMVVVVTHNSSNEWTVEEAQDFPSDTEIPGEKP